MTVGFDDLSAELAGRRAEHLYRTRLTLDSPQSTEVVLDGKRYLSFCSNDYLGLADHPDLVKSGKGALDEFGVGSGASHLVTGHSRYHQQLEEALAEFTGRPRALLFSTGYMANLGAVDALLGRGDSVFEDRLNHASLLDAGLASGARFKRYRHLDADDLRQKLQQSEANRKLVVTDGVFSMDGDLANLPELVTAAAAHRAWTMVDDAHGFGCIGKGGRGIVDYYGLNPSQVPVLVGTLGKAFGTFGAFVAGTGELIETLIQHARTYIYTTALPAAVAAASLASLRLVETDDWRREKLRHLIARFRRGANQLGLQLMPSETPIQPLVVGEADETLALSAHLKERGILVTAIRPPTVPVGSARLRVTLCAKHSEEQIDLLLEALDSKS